jgi:hypothetical protein
LATNTFNDLRPAPQPIESVLAQSAPAKAPQAFFNWLAKSRNFLKRRAQEASSKERHED